MILARRRASGFTLIELLVAVALAIILVSTVVQIFFGSTDIFKMSEARLTVFANTRAAIEIFARDLQSALPVESGLQRFLINRPPAGGPGWDSTANLPIAAGTMGQDSIQFRTILPVTSDNVTGRFLPDPMTPDIPAQSALRTVHVLFSLREDRDPELLSDTGTDTSTRTQRRMYVLQRRVYNPSVNSFLIAPPITTVNLPARDGPEEYHNPGVFSERLDLCQYVLSLNFEYLVFAAGRVASFAPNAPGSPISPFFTANLPLGGAPATDPRLPVGVRVMLRVVEGAGERQERVFLRTIWVPLS